jgi:Family of unknown function (DUF6049)
MSSCLHRGAATVLVMVLGLLSPGLATAQAAPPPGPNALVQLDLTDLSPRMVTTASTPMLRVSGRVVNVSDHPISKLSLRVQRDEALGSDDAAIRALQARSDAPHLARLQPMPGDLAPGQSSPFQLEVPLHSGADSDSLEITKPGVYPVLVSLNGQPDPGAPTQLASVPLLLPVLGIPPPRPGAAPGPVLQRPAQPAPVTIVWPLAAAPQRLPTGPGEPILLRSDRVGVDPLAAEVAPGGRLDGLLGALEQALPPGSPLGAAVCVAVDPLLLETLDGMSHGYRVSDPRGISTGTGARDARSWLDRLRVAVQGRCVLPLPYADADLVALSRAGLTDLEALALSTGARLVSEELGVQPLSGVSWPAGEVLDEHTLSDLTTLQTRAVLLTPRGVATPPGGDVVTPVGGSSSTANLSGALPAGHDTPIGLLVDPLLSTAMSDPTSPPTNPPMSSPTNSQSGQNGLGTLMYRAENGRGVLLVPPRRWQVRGPEATALLTTAGQLLAAGFLTPRELPALAATRPGTATGPATVRYSAAQRAEEIPPQITAEIARDRDVLHDLQVATVLDPAANLRPATLLDPLRLGLLRGASTAWREVPTEAALVTSAQSSQLDEVRRSVRILQPPGPYSLAASDSPLLITVSNELPVAVQVALNLSETAGLRAGAVGLQLVPAHSTRQLIIPAKVSRAGQFSVDASLSTPGGTPLGEPSTLQLRSTAFGRVTVALTSGAAALLVLLVARRVVLRIRRRVRRTPEAG